MVCKDYPGIAVCCRSRLSKSGDKLRDPGRERERERERREGEPRVQLLRTGRIHACSSAKHLTGLKYLFVVVVREYASCNKTCPVHDDKFLHSDGRFVPPRAFHFLAWREGNPLASCACLAAAIHHLRLRAKQPPIILRFPMRS